jgi:hypothetical protein
MHPDLNQINWKDNKEEVRKKASSFLFLYLFTFLNHFGFAVAMVSL